MDLNHILYVVFYFGERRVNNMDKNTKELIDLFTKMRDTSDDIIKALENDDEKAMESAMGRFLFICLQMDSLKQK